MTKRFTDCVDQRQSMPNIIAVNFTASGDLFKTVRELNAAIARQSGVTARIEDLIDYTKSYEPATKAATKELAQVARASAESNGSRTSPRRRPARSWATSPTTCRRLPASTTSSGRRCPLEPSRQLGRPPRQRPQRRPTTTSP